MGESSLFVPEFHDASVHNFEWVDSALQELMRPGPSPWHIMVIPSTEGAPPQRVQAFAQQLRAWVDQGHYLHVHGFQHRAPSGSRRSWLGRLALLATQNEAEFAGLNAHDSSDRLDLAQQAWQALDCGPAHGFVAPTWHANRHLAQQCLREGFTTLGTRWFIIHLPSGAHLLSPAISFAGLPSWSLGTVRFVAKVYIQVCAWIPLPLPRLVWHPVDFEGSQKAASLRWWRSLKAFF